MAGMMKYQGTEMNLEETKKKIAPKMAPKIEKKMVKIKTSGKPKAGY